ncbi:hypothetical protein CsSME_00048159 [Camellia sinensis var. sinensis]
MTALSWLIFCHKMHELIFFLILVVVALFIVTYGTACFRGYRRRKGERRRKSVRGCIVGQDLSVLNLVIVKKGENDLPGLIDIEKPRMRGPKRASKIRKLFNLSKEDDVRKYVNTYRRTFTTKSGKSRLVPAFLVIKHKKLKGRWNFHFAA